jgi:hypothetical protein
MIAQIPGFPWPAGQTWLIHHTQLTRYLRAFSSWLGINVGDTSTVIEYNTRVELVKKRMNQSGAHYGWTLVLKKFVKLDEHTYEESWWEEVSALEGESTADPARASTQW